MQLSAELPNSASSDEPRVAFITAVIGPYELTCKPFVEQSIASDFICFTNVEKIVSNGWIIDTHPYHDTNPSALDQPVMINSLRNNRHTFNIAKYYKQSWHNIPRLKDYDAVVWLDGTVEITNPETAAIVLEKARKYGIVGWNHEMRYGKLESEVADSQFFRYTSTFWFDQEQPYQDVLQQYADYLRNGYDETYWARVERQEGRGSGQHFGVWLTCFVGFDNKSEAVHQFLDKWYLQTLRYTTQDQIGFPRVVQETGLIPYTFPDEATKGDNPHFVTDLYTKRDHGQ